MKKKWVVLGIMAALGGSLWNVQAAEVPISYELAPVVVTASRVEEPILEAKADISVVSRKEIEEMHIDTVEEALRTVPGVQFLNYGQNGINANLSGIRINGSNDVVILVDGVRVTDFQNATDSGYMYASLMNNMSNIERVEVLRGAAGTVYGSGAKGGVINIITRKINQNSSMIDMSRGSFSKENYHITSQGRAGRLSYNVYIDKNLSGSFKDGDGKRWDGRTNSGAGGIKIAYDVTDTNTLTVQYDRVDTDYSGQDYIYKGPYSGFYKTKTLSIRDDWKIDDHWNNMLVYRQNRIKTMYYKPYGEGDASGTISSPYAVTSHMKYDFLSDQVEFKDDRNTLLFGMDYSKAQDQQLGQIGYTEDGDPAMGYRSMKNYSFYVQEDWKVMDRLTLSGGLRHDRPEGDSAAPDLDSHTAKSYKLSWDLTDKDTFYAGRSDFYILPSPYQLYDAKYGNDKLKPAYGRTSTIGYNRKFSDRQYLTVNYFETKSERTIGYASSGQYENYTGGIARGWNAQYNLQIGDNWNARVGWAHLYANASAGDNFAKGYYPKDMATFGIYYTKEKVNVAFDGFYFMRRKNPENADKKGWPADNYGVYNVSVNYSPNKQTTVYMKVENLFDKLWAEHTDVIWNGVPGSWYSMPGRALTIGMQYKF